MRQSSHCLAPLEDHSLCKPPHCPARASCSRHSSSTWAVSRSSRHNRDRVALNQVESATRSAGGVVALQIVMRCAILSARHRNVRQLVDQSKWPRAARNASHRSAPLSALALVRTAAAQIARQSVRLQSAARNARSSARANVLSRSAHGSAILGSARSHDAASTVVAPRFAVLMATSMRVLHHLALA